MKKLTNKFSTNFKTLRKNRDFYQINLKQQINILWYFSLVNKFWKNLENIRIHGLVI